MVTWGTYCSSHFRNAECRISVTEEGKDIPATGEAEGTPPAEGGVEPEGDKGDAAGDETAGKGIFIHNADWSRTRFCEENWKLCIITLWNISILWWVSESFRLG